MKRRSKRYKEMMKSVDRMKDYSIDDAIKTLKSLSNVKFNETFDFCVRLGVDSKHADQMVRGTVVLPHGTGKTKKILVFASGDKIKEAQDAGADYVGGDELADKIVRESWVDFDAVIATPDMMKVVGKLGKVLGPRGLMPSPKTGTTTMNVAGAVKEVKAGKIEFKVNKQNEIHLGIGKIAFSESQLKENFLTLVTALVKSKPSASKGQYLRGMTLKTTMGPGLAIDLNEVRKLTE